MLLSSLVNGLSLDALKANELDARHTQLQPRDIQRFPSFAWTGGQVVGPQFASATADVIIPNITFPYGYNASARYTSSVWVGIGGDQNVCDDWGIPNAGGLIQVGYYYLYNPEGDFGVFAFYEWWPEPPVLLDNTEGIVTNIGDHVRMTVTQKGNTTGTVIWENLTTKEKFTRDIKAGVNGTLCANHAEWMIESFMTEENHETQFPDFGELRFNNIKATSVAGEQASLADSILLAAEPIMGSGKQLARCDIIQPDATTCKWLGYEGMFD
ncbi:hypothetical protein F66182_3343 [Fusarium sp. NRRL 66182]|nr:hypothetical protein F66182_3343 [Fusarium sp. NRRL 66182]